MALPTLPLAPDESAEQQRTPKLRVAQFGDGYAQRAPAGINHDLQNWKLTWARSRKARLLSTYNLFVERAGYLPFNWTPPGETKALKFVCESYGFRYPFGPSSDIVELSVEIKQVP